uniref:Uncharacterized protein LOC104226712 n=1 Tax=Nicotiana sylvestris TaxID=4096 RepID=A0A1U7WS36_NICSY|nr:PREDICTED: uncharacterized protein LOC104226712 [Nicotiana sylvestris]
MSPIGVWQCVSRRLTEVFAGFWWPEVSNHYINRVLLCFLRYGRFRPWWSPLGKKLKGWQIAWWQYAQQSVLLDVQQRLMRTSWKYLGERLNRRRKYVNFVCLRQDQGKFIRREIKKSREFYE